MPLHYYNPKPPHMSLILAYEMLWDVMLAHYKILSASNHRSLYATGCISHLQEPQHTHHFTAYFVI